MKIRANVKINNDVFQFESEQPKLKDGLVELLQVSNLFSVLTECSLCHAEEFTFYSQVTKEGYKYIKAKCANCGAQATMGEKKEDGSLFWRRDESGRIEWKKYEPKK